MANVGFVLKEPYLKSKEKDKELRDQENQLIKRKIQKARAKGVKRLPVSLLNPKETRIYLTFSIGRDRVVKIKTDESIKPRNWNFQVQEAFNIIGSVELNNRLSELKSDVERLYRIITLSQPSISFEQIVDKIKELVKTKQFPDLSNSSEEPDFYEIFDEFIDVKTGQLAERTIKKYKTAKQTLLEFQEKTGYRITFETIDLKFYDKFVAYLQTKPNPLRKRVGLLNDSIGKFIANIKSFMQWSLDRGYHSNLVFKKKEFKVSKVVKNDIVTLTEEEISLMYNLDLSQKPHLERVRDLFVFALYTGQRWGDYEKFRREEIHGNEWHFEQEKTEVYMRLPLTGFSSPAFQVLVKYNYELPKMTQQHFNDEIKIIGELAGINTITIIRRKIGSKVVEKNEPKYEFMSSHMARRTCITLLLEKGVPATTVMKLSGHTDIRTMMKYENTSNKALKQSLNKIQNTLHFKIA